MLPANGKRRWIFFADAERRQREWRPTEPLLYSLQGYLYCDLLLSSGQAAEARDRAAQTIEIARRESFVLERRARHSQPSAAPLAPWQLQSLGGRRASQSRRRARDDLRAAAVRFDERGRRPARRSGTIATQVLVRGFIARAAFQTHRWRLGRRESRPG